MPVIFRIANIRFSIYSRDHNPPHVHINKPGCELVVDLRNLVIIYSVGFKPSQAFSLVRKVEEFQDDLLREWENYHE